MPSVTVKTTLPPLAKVAMPVGVNVTDALFVVLDVLLISVTPLTTVPGMATVNAAFAPVATGVYSVADAVFVLTL